MDDTTCKLCGKSRLSSWPVCEEHYRQWAKGNTGFTDWLDGRLAEPMTQAEANEIARGLLVGWESLHGGIVPPDLGTRAIGIEWVDTEWVDTEYWVPRKRAVLIAACHNAMRLYNERQAKEPAQDVQITWQCDRCGCDYVRGKGDPCLCLDCNTSTAPHRDVNPEPELVQCAECRAPLRPEQQIENRRGEVVCGYCNLHQPGAHVTGLRMLLGDIRRQHTIGTPKPLDSRIAAANPEQPAPPHGPHDWDCWQTPTWET